MAERTAYQAPRYFEGLRPQASPVDTFVQAPQVPRGNQLADLAEGLSKFDAGLRGFLNERKQKADEEDAILGEAQFHKDNASGFAAGVASGEIPADRSKAFVEGYKRAQGNVAGYEIEQRFRAAYDTWAGKGDPDPAKFDAFLRDFIGQNIKTNDPAILRGLLPRLRSMAENGVSRADADRSNYLKRRNLETAGAEVNIAADEARRDAIAKRQTLDVAALHGRIEKVYTDNLARGGNPDDLSKMVIDGVTAKALERPSTAKELLAFFDRKVPGQSYTWGDTPYGRDQKAKTIDALETVQKKAVVEEEKKRKEEEQKAKDSVTRRAITSLATNPDAPFPEEMLKEGEKYDPEFRTKVNTWRENIRRGAASTNPEALRDLNWEIIQSGGRNTDRIIQRGMENGILNNKDDLVAAYKLAETVQKEGNRFESIRKSASAENVVRTIKDRTLSSADKLQPFAPGGMSDEGLAARHDFERMILEWAAKNPNATAMEQEEAIGKIGSVILGRLGRADSGLGATTYDRQGLPPGNPYAKPPAAAPAPQPQATTPAAPATPTAPITPVDPMGNPTGATPGQAPAAATAPTQQQPAGQTGFKSPVDWYNSLPPETQAKAAQRSLQTGQSLTAIIEEGFRRVQGGAAPSSPQPQPQAGNPQQSSSVLEQAGREVQAALASFNEDDPVAASVVEQVGRTIEQALRMGRSGNTQSYTLAALKDDPKAAGILDFISGPESRGNYNAVFGLGDSAHDLSKYTLDGILAGQHFEALGGRVRGQSATGRYQIINKTLRGLKDELGLSGAERFTPELQDRLALQLLRRRGYDRWREGKMSTETFALNLAREWASLPDLRTGRSVYDGDGLNKSHVTPKQVLAALGSPAADGDGEVGPNNIYANIPRTDSKGEDQIAKFMKWNPDPIGNHEKNLASIKPTLANVFRKAQADNPGLRFVIGSGKRDEKLQAEAVKWGWSKTSDSNHLHGGAADLWPVDENGRITFDEARQVKIAQAVKKAAADLGVLVVWGGDWKSFKDRPHFELEKD